MTDDHSPDAPAEATAATADAVPGPVPDAVPARSGRRTVLAMMAFALPILLAVAVIVVLSGQDGGAGSGGTEAADVPPGQTYRYVIPRGTAYKMRNNQPVVDIMPEWVDLKVGDTIVVENQDEDLHTFGPISVRAGETTAMQFRTPGYYFGVCSAGTHDTITFSVTA